MSPLVAQWLHFRASVRKGMAFSPRRGTPFLYICFQLYFCVFWTTVFFYLINQVMSVFLRKDIEPA